MVVNDAELSNGKTQFEYSTPHFAFTQEERAFEFAVKKNFHEVEDFYEDRVEEAQRIVEDAKMSWSEKADAMEEAFGSNNWNCPNEEVEEMWVEVLCRDVSHYQPLSSSSDWQVCVC